MRKLHLRWRALWQQTRRGRGRASRVGHVGALFACISAAGAPAVARGAQPIEPTWTWAPAGGIEWVEPAGPGETAALLLATRDAHLHLLDPHSGQNLLTPAVSARPGVMPAAWDCATDAQSAALPSAPAHGPAASEAPRAYCFDRFRVYALEVGAPARLRWQAGVWREGLGEGAVPTGQPGQMFQGDPEELRRIVAACRTAWGLLLVRDDGRAALLAAADGRVLWASRLAGATNIRVHVRGRNAALLWQAGPTVTATLFDLPAGERRDRPLAAGTTWPTWSALTGHGLLLADPGRFVLVPPDAVEQVCYRADAAGILAAAITLHEDARVGAAPAPRPLLIFGSGDGRLRALDPWTASVLWTAGDQEGRAVDWRLLHVRRDVVLSGFERALHLRSVRTGELVARVGGVAEGRLLDATLDGPTVWLLWLERGTGEPRLRLEELRSRDAPATEPAGFGAGPSRSHDLGTVGVFVRALWHEGYLVVATRSALRAYRLR